MSAVTAFASVWRSFPMPGAADTVAPIVFVVDDDVSVRESLESLIADAGWRPEVYASAEEFLDRPRQGIPGCLVLDLALPDLSGLEVQRRIADRTDLPVIFITGHGDIPTTVQAMKGGAVEFLTKPFVPEELLGMIRSALARSRAHLEEAAGLRALRKHYDSLTNRERQVMTLVVRGLLNKQVAGELGISEITVHMSAPIAMTRR
jgi:FixJ family two-component response regulator